VHAGEPATNDFFREEQARHLDRVNQLRFAGASAFFSLFVILGVVLRLAAWQANLSLFFAYWIFSGAVVLGTHRFGFVRRISGLAVALLDMPIVFFLQLSTFPYSDANGVAGFTIGIYVFLLLLAALTLEPWALGLTTVSGIFFEGTLQHLAKVDPGAIVASAILLTLAALACGYGRNRLLEFAERLALIAKEQQVLKDLAKKTQDQALVDSLTGLYNRQGFVTLAEQQLASAARNLTSTDAEPAIEWIAARGIWEGQTNLEEARLAVDALHGQLTDPRRLSVGIITFNAKQQEAIEREIEKRKVSSPDFAELYLTAMAQKDQDHRPVVKNIENVQGDERDVVIFSVGYGEGADGTFRRQFSVSQPGGTNRLNVAITRAKEKILVICSFDPEELAVDEAKNQGPFYFRQYLRYAKAVAGRDSEAVRRVLAEVSSGMLKTKESIAPSFDSPFEVEVYDRLTRAGLKVKTQWGYSSYKIDLAVVHPHDPHRFCLAIECDGAMFHSGKTVRERDIARQRFLESRGWVVSRIWSRNWWQNPDREVERICQLVADAAQSAPRMSQRQAPPRS
jgi:very-short-patch-repair endonuclease